MASIGVLGCTGRVGTLLVREIRASDIADLAGGTVVPGTPATTDFFMTSDPAELFSRADVLIDFTQPDATARHVWLAAKHHKPLVIGTTGLNEQQEQEIRQAALETAIVYTANMSVGVNLLLALVEQAAGKLGLDWDIEIAETHHRNKIDAPSGTALALGKAAEKGRKPSSSPFVTERNGKRDPGAIGFSVQRGGDVVGEHTVSFLTDGERLELGHKATDRSLFAKGALRAALWLHGKPHGLYTMRDVLGL